MTGQKTSQIVTLFGTILRSDAPGSFVLDVAAELGDAARYGLAGQITLARRQCREIHERCAGERYDIVRLPAHVAELKGKTTPRR